MLRSQLLLYLAVIIYLALLGVYQQYLTRLQAALLCHLRGIKVHHAYLTRHYHRVVLRNGIAGRAQSVAIQHATRKATVAEQQRSRTVPRLHQDRVILIERLQVFAYGVLVIEALRHKYRHSVRQRHSRHDKELQHIVQRSRVAHALLHNGCDVRTQTSHRL